MEIAAFGTDLGKNSCSIVGLDDGEALVLRRRMRRTGVIKLAAKLKPCVVRRGNGGVLRSASSWPRSAGSGP